MSEQIWAVVNHKGEALPVSNSGHGAKCYATRHGYRAVCKVSTYSMTCYNLIYKINGKWTPQQ